MVIYKKNREKKKNSKPAKTSSGTQFWRLNLLFTDFDWFLNIFGFRVNWYRYVQCMYLL